jgi:hypothetical protein
MLICALLSLLISISSKGLKAEIHPNVADITTEYHKMVKPFYQKEFFPQEVNSIREPEVKPVGYNFNVAEIVGGQQPNGVQEKPTMYSTIFSHHATSVLHPIPKMGNTVSQAADALYSEKPAEDYPVRKISPGEYAIPVKLEMNNRILNEPNTAGYEYPSITKSRRSTELNKLVQDKALGEDHIMMAQVKEDINNITSKLKGVKTNPKKDKNSERWEEKIGKRSKGPF